jgi:hypothetical protein
MNPVPVNSANIANFGFSALFKLFEKQIIFTLAGYTTFINGNCSNIQGVYFQVIDPSGIVIKAFDLSTPDIAPCSDGYTVAIPNNLFVYGWWQLSATIKDQDGTLTTVTVNKNICEPLTIQNGQIAGTLVADVNCSAPSIKITETTNMAYSGKSPVLLTKSGTFYYPQGTLDSQAFTTTPFLISGSDSIYTGDYLVKNTSAAQYDLGDGVLLQLNYVTTLAFSVTCNSGLASIICCIAAVNDIYDQWPDTQRGKAAKAQLDKISSYLFLAISNEKVGLPSDQQVAQIAAILGCDCNCGGQLVSPVPVSAQQTIVVAPACGIAVDQVTEGSNTTFTISGSVSHVTNGTSDLAFNVIKTSSGCIDTYAISFNYAVLAENILVAIKESDDLSSLLNTIIDKTLFADSLIGFDGKCIVDLTMADYILAVPIAEGGVQTVNSIFINGNNVTAPGGLSLENTTGLATWLNSLSLGTFTVVEDDMAGTVTIQSLANTVKVSTLTVTTIIGGNTSEKTFIFSSSTKSLVQLLQLLFDYICAIDTTEIAFGVAGLQQYSFSTDFSAVNKITIDQAAKLSSVLTNLITAQQQLFTRLAAVGLTCGNMQALFTVQDLVVTSVDGVYGTKSGKCVFILFSDLAGIMLNQITASADLQGLLCGLSQGCGGAVCAPVTNVSAVFAAGTLTVNANDTNSPSTPIKVRYRVYNSGLTFTEVDTTASALPLAIGGGALTNAQYEVQISQQCSNGVYSPWAAGSSNNGCAVPLSASVAIAGANFSVSVQLAGTQTIVEVLVTDPSGGQATYIQNFGVTAGSFNIPIAVGLLGTYSFQIRGVCDNTSTPRFVSAFMAPISVPVGSGVVNNFYVWAGYGMSLQITGGTATGIPSSFTGLVVTSNASDYTATVVAGTIIVTPAGTLLPPTAHLQLVKNSTTVIQSVALSGTSPITLTLPSNLNAPDVLSIQIVTP